MALPGRLASHSAIIFAARIVGAATMFAAQAAIARIWGATILGEYLLVFATINLLALFMPLGFQTVGAYFGADYRARMQGKHLRDFLVRAYGHVLGVALLVYLLGPFLVQHLGGAGELMRQLWPQVVLGATSIAVVFVNGAVLVGLKRPFAALSAEVVMRPMLVLATFFVAATIAGDEPALGMMFWLVAASYAVVALVHLAPVVLAVRAVPEGGETAQPRDEARRWWRFALPWVLIVVATDFFFDLHLLLLSGLMGREELAIFGACTRIFAIAAFGVSAVYSLTLPDMFEAEASRDRPGFQKRVGDANLVAAGLSIVLLVGVTVGGPVVLWLFGPSFQAGALPLVILSLALVVRSVFGPSSLVLTIHDRPWSSLPAVVGSLGALVVLNLALVPPFGLMGAAMAALIAITVWSAWLWVLTRRLTGIDVSIFQSIRSAVA